LLIDTHAHLHHDGLKDRVDEVVQDATSAGVTTIINVGVTEQDSRQAVELASRYDNIYATIGLHPHDAESDELTSAIKVLDELATHSKVVAVGECGLDYFRPPEISQTSDLDGPQDSIKSLTSVLRQRQEPVFRAQIELALKHNLPMVWHIRDAFDDFFEIIDEYSSVKGIVHCFTSSRADMDKAVERGFLIALNGIMTFTKDHAQVEMARAVPLDNLVLETDCPFLAPVPLRGKTNEPSFLKLTAEFLAQLRGESPEDLARATSGNAAALFGLKF
jgi:TatD DNase family protein